jgi:chromosome partitioning protein
LVWLHWLDDDVLDKTLISKAIAPARDNLWLLESGGEYLLGLAIEISKKEQLPFDIRDALAKVKDKFDFCIIDTSPSRNLITTMAVVASDWVLIPVSAGEYLAGVGATTTNNMIETIRNGYRLAGAQLAYVVPTFLDRRRRKATDETLQALKQVFGNKLSSPIRVNSRLSDCPAYGQTVYELGDKIGIEDFDQLAEEVLGIAR